MPGETNKVNWHGTLKIYPAIADLQAVKDVLKKSVSEVNQNCVSFHRVLSPGVPAGEVWVVTNLTATNQTTMCDIEFEIFDTPFYYDIAAFYSIPGDITKHVQGLWVLKEDDEIGASFLKGGASDDLIITVNGYIVGVY